MPWYGVTHFVPLAIFVAGLVVVVRIGHGHRTHTGPAGPTSPTGFSRTWALALPAVTVPFQVIDLVANFDVAVTLPLHLCDLAWIAATWALWTHRPFPVTLTYLWGLVLTVQAIVTPALNEDFPHPRYLAFWALHILIVWAAVYLVIGLRLTPRWREYRAVVATTLGWAVATYAFNLAAGTNYGYLMRKPRASVLDYLGPWPWYVVAEIALVTAIWALLTWAAQAAATRLWRGIRRRRARSRPS